MQSCSQSYNLVGTPITVYTEEKGEAHGGDHSTGVYTVPGEAGEWWSNSRVYKVSSTRITVDASG